MKRMTAMATLVASIAMAPIVLAPTAHADAEQDYLNEVTPQPAWLFPSTPGQLLELGREACADLHSGMSPQAIPNADLWARGGPPRRGTLLYVSPGVVAAAQHYLCPDTLGPPAAPPPPPPGAPAPPPPPPAPPHP